MGFITGRGPTLKFCSRSKCEFARLEKTCPGQVNGSLFGLCPSHQSEIIQVYGIRIPTIMDWQDGFNPFEKYESQFGWLFPTEWKNNMFQSPPDIVLKEVGSVKSASSYSKGKPKPVGIPNCHHLPVDTSVFEKTLSQNGQKKATSFRHVTSTWCTESHL